MEAPRPELLMGIKTTNGTGNLVLTPESRPVHGGGWICKLNTQSKPFSYRTEGAMFEY